MSEFKIDGETYSMIESKFTFAEGKALERATGETFQAIFNDPKVRQSLDVMQALLWVSMKRVKPDLKFSDLEHVAIDDIEWVEDEEPSADPQAPADQAGEPSNN